MKKTFSTLLLLFFLHSLSAQNLPAEALKKHLQASKIVMLDSTVSLIKAQSSKNKKWGIFQNFGSADEEDIYTDALTPFMFDSIAAFKHDDPFVVVKNKGKYGIIVNPVEESVIAKKVKFLYEEIKSKRVKRKDQDDSFYVIAKMKGKWGLVDWQDGFVVVDFIYNSPEQVPLLTLDEWIRPHKKALQKKLNADLLASDLVNEDEVFKARNKKTKKWGLFQGHQHPEEFIPMQYDSLRFFSFNGNFTPVYNKGKVGFYLRKPAYDEKTRESVPCIYEDYYKYNVSLTGYDLTEYLAVKKDGKWGWVDWLTGEMRSDFKYNTKEELPFPDFEQKTYLEEPDKDED